MILLCQLALKSEGTRPCLPLDDKITTQLSGVGMAVDLNDTMKYY